MTAPGVSSSLSCFTPHHGALKTQGCHARCGTPVEQETKILSMPFPSGVDTEKFGLVWDC